MRTISLCGRGKCCPEVHIEENKVYITDDYGGIITLDKAEFIKLQQVKL